MRLAAPRRLTLACGPVCVWCHSLQENGFDNAPAKEQLKEIQAAWGETAVSCRQHGKRLLCF